MRKGENYEKAEQTLCNMMLPHMMKHRAYYRKKALDLLQKLDMSHLRKKNAARLSGGETQRLALARLLMRDYDVLLLDEPTASMDINSTALTEEVLRKYCERVRPVVVMATHSMQQARRLADYVIFLDNGKAEEIAPPEKLFACPSSDKTRDFLNFNFLGEQF